MKNRDGFLAFRRQGTGTIKTFYPRVLYLRITTVQWEMIPRSDMADMESQY